MVEELISHVLACFPTLIFLFFFSSVLLPLSSPFLFFSVGESNLEPQACKASILILNHTHPAGCLSKAVPEDSPLSPSYFKKNQESR